MEGSQPQQHLWLGVSAEALSDHIVAALREGEEVSSASHRDRALPPEGCLHRAQPWQMCGPRAPPAPSPLPGCTGTRKLQDPGAAAPLGPWERSSHGRGISCRGSVFFAQPVAGAEGSSEPRNHWLQGMRCPLLSSGVIFDFSPPCTTFHPGNIPAFLGVTALPGAVGFMPLRLMFAP